MDNQLRVIVVLSKISFFDFCPILIKLGTKGVYINLKPNKKLFYKIFEFLARYGMSDCRKKCQNLNFVPF